MPALPAPPPEALSLPGFSDLWGILADLSFDDAVATLDDWIEKAQAVLGFADKVSFIVPGLKPDIHALLGVLNWVHGALHKQP